MGTKVYQISGGNPSGSGNQNFARYLASLIANDSSVAGATVKAALEALSSSIPVTSDNIFNASLVSGLKVTNALDALLSSVLSNTSQINTNTAAITGVGSYPYIAPPTSPNAFDDEFSSGSPDLAARGYTVVNAAGVTLTRSGNIDPWSATGPAGNTYWSTIIGSWLWLQAAPAVQIDFYKTISLAAGDTYYARTVGTYNLASAAVSHFNEVGLYGASGAALDNNNRVYTTVRTDTTVGYLVYDCGRVTASAFVGPTGRYALGGHDIRGVRFDSGTTHNPFFLDSQNGEPKAITSTGTPAAATLTRFGMRNVFSVSGSAIPQLWGVDFVRKKTGNAWLIG